MTDVISLADERRRRAPTELAWTVCAYRDAEGIHSGRLLDLPPDLTHDDRLRIAADMEHLARNYRLQIEQERGAADADRLVTVSVFRDSRVRVWQHDAIQSQEQVEWARRQIEGGKALVLPAADQIGKG